MIYIADLEATKTDGLTQVAAEMALTYTIGVTNQGPSDVAGATVTDTFPAGLTGVTWTCAASAGASCTPLGSGSINDTVNLAHGTSLTDNSATRTTAVVFSSDLSITKIDGRSTLVPGEPVTYTIVVANAGPSQASGVTVTDTPPVALLSPAWTCSGTGGASCPAGSGTSGISQTVSLPAGGALTWQLTGTVDPAAIGTLAHTASVAVPPTITDPVTGNNSATDSEPLTRVADLHIVPSGPGTVARGGALALSFTVTNAGPSRSAPAASPALWARSPPASRSRSPSGTSFRRGTRDPTTPFSLSVPRGDSDPAQSLLGRKRCTQCST